MPALLYRRATAALVALLLVWPIASRAAAAEATREYQLKAVFLYNVMKFVTWPDAALGPASAPITVAVVGRDAAEAASGIFATKQLMGRRIVVTAHDTARDLPAAHVVFITADAERASRDVLQAVAGQAVLTVTETPGAGALDPVITLAVVQTKLAFSVNLDAADAQGLQLSSSLLGLATRVQTTRLKKDGPR